MKGGKLSLISTNFLVHELKHMVEGARVVQSGEEKMLGKSYSHCAVPIGGYKRAREGLLKRACSDRTKGNGFRLKDCGFKFDVRNKFFSVNEEFWHRSAREIVAASNLKVFKVRLDKALRSLI